MSTLEWHPLHTTAFSFADSNGTTTRSHHSFIFAFKTTTLSANMESKWWCHHSENISIHWQMLFFFGTFKTSWCVWMLFTLYIPTFLLDTSSTLYFPSSVNTNTLMHTTFTHCENCICVCRAWIDVKLHWLLHRNNFTCLNLSCRGERASFNQWEVSTEPTVAPTVPPSVCLATSPHSAASVSTRRFPDANKDVSFILGIHDMCCCFSPPNRDDNFLLFKTDAEHIYVYQFLHLDSPVVCVAHLEVIKSGFNKLYL